MGCEHPVGVVLKALLAERKRFSKEFRDDLDALFSVYLKQGRDPKDSPFWRAIRQEARDPSSGGFHEGKASGRATLLAEWDEDDLLTPFVAFPDDWIPPDDWQVKELEFRIGDLSRRANLDLPRLAE